MNWRRAVVLFALGAAGCVRHHAATTEGHPSFPRLAARFANIVRAHIAGDSLPGAIFAMVDTTGSAFGAAYGWADIEHRIPMSDSTILNIASVSKPITAILVMRLVAGGKLSLDEPVMNVARGWTPPAGFDSARVTVRQLLSHSAGLGMPSVPCPPLDSTRPRTSEALCGTFGDRGPLTVIGSPGQHFAYSGGGYTLLQLALESRFGMPFAALADREVFATLGMHDATADPRPGVPRAVPYAEDGKPLPAYRCVGESAGGVYLSERDAARLLHAYIAVGETGAFGSVIDSVSIPRISVEVPGVDVGGARYGFGHFIAVNAEGDTLIFHSGGNPGAVAFLAVNRHRHTGIFVAANSERGIALVRHLLAEWARSGGFSPPPVF